MFWAFISNVLSSVSTVYYKQSLSLARISDYLFSYLWELSGLFISICLVLIFGFDKAQITRQNILWILFIIVVVTVYDKLSQRLYRKEKISEILPYDNLNSIFAIIFWFLIFRDASLTSFFIAILAFVVTILFSVDFKTFTVPKSIKLIFWIQILMTLETLFTWWLLKNLPDNEYYVIYEVLILIVLLIPILLRREYLQLKWLKRKFYWSRFLWSMSGNLSFLLYLFMVGEFGIVMSILFSFIWTGITLLFGYLFFKEKPSKKEIILAVIVALIVWLWFIFQ